MNNSLVTYYTIPDLIDGDYAGMVELTLFKQHIRIFIEWDEFVTTWRLNK